MILEIFEFDETIENNFINNRSPTVKFLASLWFLIVIFLETSFFALTTIFSIILVLSIFSQGSKRILHIYWSLKYYILVVIFVTLMFNQLKLDHVLLITTIKLLSIFIAFSFFSKTTTPEKLIDVLIQLKIPPNIAWGIGVSFRQAILILDDVYHIQSIQRLRNDYYDMRLSSKLVFRIKEIYNMLVSILGRSVIVSTEFARAIKMRGWKGAHKNIIFDNSPINFIDYIFLLVTFILTLTILIML